MKQALLEHLRAVNRLHLDRVSEPMRQRLIDLGMQEPPLVEVDGPWVSLTEAGRRSAPLLGDHGGRDA